MFRTALISMFLTSTALADTWTVDDDGKADFDNIQAAIGAASNGDEIVVMPGTYTSTEDKVVDMLGKEIWLHSSGGAGVTIIDGEGARRGILCEYLTNKAKIEGFTIRSGRQDTYGGAGMYCENSNHVIEDCFFYNNVTYVNGAGMHNLYSSPSIINCTFSENRASAFPGGGMYNNQSNPTLVGCTFVNNFSSSDGGGLCNYSSYPILNNCIITNNAANNGGGMLNWDCNPILTNTIVCGNTPDQIYGDWSDNGGNTIADECEPVTWTVDDDGKADFDNIQAAVDASSDGDEIIVMPGTYTGDTYNVVNMMGKSVFLHSSDGLEVTIIDGEGKRRGIKCDSGETSGTHISGFTVRNCYASGKGVSSNGGGIYIRNSNPIISSCNIMDNVSLGSGGGIKFHGSSSNILDCKIESNMHLQGNGGGVDCYYSSPTFEDCDIRNNYSVQFGGALCCSQGSAPSFNRCNITNNSAGSNGGGLYTYSLAFNITNTVICGNSPNNIVGGWNDGGGNTITDECPTDCPADINGDEIVNVNDLLIVIGYWGTADTPADINDDSIVDVSDLLIVVGNWGPCE